MTADGTHLLWNGCKVAILLLRYICSHSCTACAGMAQKVQKQVKAVTQWSINHGP